MRGTPDAIEVHAAALERLVQHVFGGRHGLLPIEHRRLRLDIWRFVNLLRQMDTLDDVEVFDLAFRCPEQLKSYDRALLDLIDLAERRGMDEDLVMATRLTHRRLWRVRQTVTQFCAGLS